MFSARLGPSNDSAHQKGLSVSLSGTLTPQVVVGRLLHTTRRRHKATSTLTTQGSISNSNTIGEDLVTMAEQERAQAQAQAQARAQEVVLVEEEEAFL